MTVGCDKEFETVNLLVNSSHGTRGVDAFCLAWIKYERQLRKITAFLVYQTSALNRADQAALRKTFLDNKGISHTSTRGSFWRLTGKSAKTLVGDRYAFLSHSLNSSYVAREKIFHGQQTGSSLSRDNLITRVSYIEEWCRLLSDAASANFGYDGFEGSTSLFKVDNPLLTKAVDEALAAEGWEVFVQKL